MTFRSLARRRGPRWVALLTVLLITAMLASSAVAAPVFDFDDDDQGANDEPGQKDLTAQASAVDSVSPNHFFTAWKWDDTAWSGRNTGDGCSLFDTDATGTEGSGLVDYAVCATVADGQGPDPVDLDTVTFYSCNDKWPDRCGNPVLLLTATGAAADTYCVVTDLATGTFSPTTDKDTQIACDITAIAAAATPPVAGLTGGTLLNTCSYPSREPNSDPSDCVKTITNVNTNVSTLSAGTATWSATLNDTATLSPLTATGSVVFKLWSDSACTTLVWTSPSVTLTNGVATTAGGGTPNNGNTITNLTVDTDGIYYWTVAYTPTGAFNSSSSACGEATTITPASVSGSAG